MLFWTGIGRTTRLSEYKESQLLAEYNEKLKIDAPWPVPLLVGVPEAQNELPRHDYNKKYSNIPFRSQESAE